MKLRSGLCLFCGRAELVASHPQNPAVAICRACSQEADEVLTEVETVMEKVKECLDKADPEP